MFETFFNVINFFKEQKKPISLYQIFPVLLIIITNLKPQNQPTVFLPASDKINQKKSCRHFTMHITAGYCAEYTEINSDKEFFCVLGSTSFWSLNKTVFWLYIHI